MKPSSYLITDKSNIAYLSNFTGSSGSILLTKNKKYLLTDFRYLERAKKSVKKGIKVVDTKNWQKILKKHKIKILGIEENNLTIEKFKKIKKISRQKTKIKFVNISGFIEKKREIKTNDEIKLIIKSQRINEKVFLMIKKIIRTKMASNRPLTEIDLVWKIKELGHKYGAEDVSFEPIVAFGKHTLSPHAKPDKTKLKKGDLVLIDMGMKYKGYCSDMTRMIFTAKPTKEQKQIYDLVLKTQLNAIKNIKAGISGKKADSFARKIIEKAGYGENFGHGSGHGVGLEIHENPSLSEKYEQPLRENSVITIEPGIYLPGKFGIRLEDMLLVTKTGNKNLTKSNK